MPFILVLMASLFIYTRYFLNLNFGDEYDNFVYSWLFSQGYIPYRDFFTHHWPTLVILGLPIEFLGHSKVLYRTLVLLVTFGFFTFFYFYLKGFLRHSILALMIMASFGISLYSGAQFADGTFWAIFIMSAFLLIASKAGQVLSFRETAALAVLALLTFLSSPIHILPFLILVGYYLFRTEGKKSLILEKIRTLRTFSFIFLSGILAVFFYFWASGAWSDFYYDLVTFNNDYFYLKVYKPIIAFRPLDFYLHTTLDVLNHFWELATREGAALLTFLKSAKFILFPEGVDHATYLKIIFGDLYNNFFSFEIFIALFVIFGVIALFVGGRKDLAILSLIFIFGLRLRLLERIHMAPYYLFSFWLVSVAIVVFASRLFSKRQVFLSGLVLVALASIITLFIVKNWYDFAERAFNYYPARNEQTVNLLHSEVGAGEQILVLSPESTSYYYDSELYPHGIFVNYFGWYDESPKLKEIWEQNLKNYQGKYLIFSKEVWNDYCSRGKFEKWYLPYLRIINSRYLLEKTTDRDMILKAIGPYDGELRQCEEKF